MREAYLQAESRRRKRKPESFELLAQIHEVLVQEEIREIPSTEEGFDLIKADYVSG